MSDITGVFLPPTDKASFFIELVNQTKQRNQMIWILIILYLGT